MGACRTSAELGHIRIVYDAKHQGHEGYRGEL